VAGPSVEALRAEVEATGRARVESIRREAQVQIARLHAEREAAAAKRLDERLRHEEVVLRSDLTRDLARARSRALGRVLEARDELLDRVFDRARERLRTALERPATRDRLVARAREALDLVPAGAVVITCSPGVEAMLQDVAAGRDEVVIETDPTLPSGFRVSGAGGALVVDATLDMLLEIERPALAVAILRALHDGRGDGSGTA